MAKPERDIEKDYPLPDFIDKLPGLPMSLEQGRLFEIQVAGAILRDARVARSSG
jgi:hypothetical protein